MAAPTRFPVAADVVALTLVGGVACVLLIERANEPFAGGLALPGGFADPGEMIEETARREFLEETGLDATAGVFVQLGAYGLAHRDPRGDTLSVVYLALAASFGEVLAGDDAAAAKWVPVVDALAPGRLAFDHEAILRDGLARAATLLDAGGSGSQALNPAFAALLRDALPVP